MRRISSAVAFPRRQISTTQRLGQLRPEREWSDARSQHVVDSLGVAERGVCEPDEDATTLAIEAARAAWAAAGEPTIDLLIACSSTSPHWTASMASHVAAALELPPLMAFDLKSGCAAGLLALVQAQALLPGGGRALIVGSDTWTRAAPDADVGVALTLGDGAGAVVLQADGDGNGDGDDGDRAARRGVVGHSIRVYPEHRALLGSTGRLPPSLAALDDAELVDAAADAAAGRHKPASYQLTGDADAARLLLPRLARDAALAALQQAGLVPEELSLLVPHAATAPAALSLGASLSLPPERISQRLARTGNCGAANVFIGWHDAAERGLDHGRWLFVAAAGGVTAAAVVWDHGDQPPPASAGGDP